MTHQTKNVDPVCQTQDRQNTLIPKSLPNTDKYITEQKHKNTQKEIEHKFLPRQKRFNLNIFDEKEEEEDETAGGTWVANLTALSAPQAHPYHLFASFSKVNWSLVALHPSPFICCLFGIPSVGLVPHS